jgi:hypothetical protein
LPVCQQAAEEETTSHRYDGFRLEGSHICASFFPTALGWDELEPLLAVGQAGARSSVMDLQLADSWPLLDPCHFAVDLDLLRKGEAAAVSTRASVRLDAVSVHASPCRVQALQGVADRCTAALREGAPPQALAWARGECAGWVYVLTWGRGMAWRDASWQRRWLVLKCDTLFELAGPHAETFLRRVAVGKGRRVLKMDQETTCGVEHALAVVSSGVSRAQAVLAADSFVWRAVDDSMCTQWEEYTTAANTSYVAVANAYSTPQPQSVLPIQEGNPTGSNTQGPTAAATAVALQVDVTCPQMSLVVSGLCASSMPAAVVTPHDTSTEMELLRLCAMGTTVAYRTRPFDSKLTLSLQSLQVLDQLAPRPPDELSAQQYILRSHGLDSKTGHAPAHRSVVERKSSGSRRALQRWNLYFTREEQDGAHEEDTVEEADDSDEEFFDAQNASQASDEHFEDTREELDQLTPDVWVEYINRAEGSPDDYVADTQLKIR